MPPDPDHSVQELVTLMGPLLADTQQRHGNPHGTLICLPVHGKVREEFVHTQSTQPLGWLRYIKDIFVVWSHGEPALQEFLGNLKRYHTTFKFTSTWSTEAITFLDTKFYLQNQRIETDLFVNPTDTQQYLHITSCHSRRCKTCHSLQPSSQMPQDMLWTAKPCKEN